MTSDMDSLTDATVVTGLFIDGEPRTTTDRLTVPDPARPHVVVGHAAAASAEQARAAVAAAARAFPSWAGRAPHERAAAMLDSVEAPAALLPAAARVLTRENGKVLRESQGDVTGLGRLFRLTAELADRVDARTELPGPPYATSIGHLPLGVVTIIVPFNWPLGILGAALPQALLAGNTVVVKPPPSAPLATTLIAERIAAALPPGVMNVVTGRDEIIGPPLVGNDQVAKVCFTGGMAGGKRVMAMAAQTLTRVTLELGGNDPVLILDDAELDDAALDRLFRAAYASTGQICMAAKRVYVHRRRYAEVVDGLSARLAATRLGHGLSEQTTMGPLHQRRQRDFVAGLVERAEAAGTEVRRFGALPEDSDLADGHFIRPSLVLDPPEQAPIVTEEQFGPALPIVPVRDDAQAVGAANATWSGLCSSVWTADLERGARIAARLRTGYTWLNAHGAGFVDQRAPFGGFKGSGMGREFGIAGIRDFMDTHTISYRVDPTG